MHNDDLCPYFSLSPRLKNFLQEQGTKPFVIAIVRLCGRAGHYGRLKHESGNCKEMREIDRQPWRNTLPGLLLMEHAALSSGDRTVFLGQVGILCARATMLGMAGLSPSLDLASAEVLIGFAPEEEEAAS